jgi:hypothetical protein
MKDLISKFEDMTTDVREPFTFEIDDPAGNCFIYNRDKSLVYLYIIHYDRSPE